MPDASLLRVVKGSPSPEELAAITAVLMARRAAGAGTGTGTGTGSGPADDTTRRARAVAPWRRPERAQGFQGPRTWRTGM
ncbi:acyl-CoA carboxylase subunit epsilon [Streptomyces monticola]|uniref:Acyl-CoA carboxylase subunit epsilon n=1 Tax=Streptomyces monticola TaxID=2666263 RepID=A0ABW2JEL8_9ACTN